MPESLNAWLVEHDATRSRWYSLLAPTKAMVSGQVAHWLTIGWIDTLIRVGWESMPQIRAELIHAESRVAHIRRGRMPRRLRSVVNLSKR